MLAEFWRATERSATNLAVALAYGVASVGATVITVGFLWHQPSALSAALQAGCALVPVMVLISRLLRLRHSDEFLRFVTVFWGLFFAVALLSRFALSSNADKHFQGLRSPLLVVLCSFVAALMIHFSGKRGNAGSKLVARIWKVACELSASVALGAGIGFLQGAFIDPVQPNMVQDGGAVVGAIIGGVLGIVLSTRRFSKPESAFRYCTGLIACLAVGLLAAKLVGLASLLFPPLVAVALSTVLRERTDSRLPCP